MAVKRRTNKRRDELTENARAWLEGRPCGFWEFRDYAGLVALWQEHGDPDVAEWDMGTHSKPVALE
jgi:hypothetical protein